MSVISTSGVTNNSSGTHHGNDNSLFCFNYPDSRLCDPTQSLYDYRLNIGANATFLALFVVSMIGCLAVFISVRRAVAFNVAFAIGILLEILGYAGRVWSWKNQWDLNAFLMQICTLTLGPAFFAAAVYLCLRRIVSAYGPENSRLRPEYYTRIFIPCDVISLVLQAVGGAMTSIAAQNNNDVNPGTHIMVAGLAFQAFTMLVFMLVAGEFALRTWRRRGTGRDTTFDASPPLAAMRATTRFRVFLAALALATICVFWRSVFRIAELSQGWDGPVSRKQGLFIGFEGVLVVVASLALNVGNPAVCARPLFESGHGGLTGLWGTAKTANTPPVNTRPDVESKVPSSYEANRAESNSD